MIPANYQHSVHPNPDVERFTTYGVNAAAHELETALTEGKERRVCTGLKTRTMPEFARGLKSRAAALL